MTTHTTATAAHLAGVTPRTIRRWATAGVVTATRNELGHWLINADSLNTRIATRIATRADRIAAHAALTPFKDQGKASDGLINLLQDGCVIPLIPGLYQVASKTSDVVYLVNTDEQTCDCKGHGRHGYCTHLTAANAVEAAKPARARRTFALAA